MGTSAHSIEEKIGQLFFIGIPGPELDETTVKLLNDIRPGGVCLFARNIKGPRQTRELLDGIRSTLNVEPFLSIDQEGGLVDRLRRILVPMPSAASLSDEVDARTEAAIIADALLALGFNMDFAPVVDVIDEKRAAFTNGLHSRAYGTSVDEVIRFAKEFLATLQSRGVIGCIKHFPGLGASEVDSHEELPTVAIGSDEFESVDLAPYRHLIESAQVHAVMVAHAAYPNLALQEQTQDGKLLPSSLSFNFVTKLLREKIGFDGLVLTDDLEMGAIMKNFGIGEAAVMAVEAGHDMVAICAGVDSIYEAHSSISNAISTGRISEDRLNESVERIRKGKAMLHLPEEFREDVFPALSARISEFSNSLTQS